MSAETSWKVWAKPLARHNYCIIPCQDIFFILLVVELDYINLNKLMVKMMSVLFQNICHMIMKGLVNSGFFFQRCVWCLVCENTNLFNVFDLIVVLEVTMNWLYVTDGKSKSRKDNADFAHRTPMAWWDSVLQSSSLMHWPHFCLLDTRVIKRH